VRRAVSVPLTVKIRSGCNAREVNALEVVHIAEDCGADAVIVHPRTADQGFGGRADWDIIKAVKRGIKIPVIGNGDVRHAADALRMINQTGCDGVMVGRGVLGNPWLIGEIISSLTDRDMPVYPSLPERGKIIARHLEMELQYNGEACGSRNFRKHLLWYTKSLPGGANFRKLAVNLRGKESILNALQRFFLSLPN
ncbi:MAG: tRNA-dihydrouridine synthase, partial [Deltaproteobacteria bacterium]|nr:tRNA-dihydrouridine synthase [Deltaproteobacteria bacterium]